MSRIVAAACWKMLWKEIDLRFSVRKNWDTIEIAGNGGRFMKNGMRVICSIDQELDDDFWIHVSCSFPDRLPSYEELKDAHETFIGDNRMSYQLFVPKKDHVNEHPYCLHLWAKYDGGPVTPDFTRGTGRI